MRKIIFMIAFLSWPAFAQENPDSYYDAGIGRASVLDADAILLAGRPVRIAGIDAPEGGQHCNRPDGREWLCGSRAAIALEDFLNEKTVKCRWATKDRINRTVATCWADGQDVGDWLVRNGWAMAFRRYSSDYVMAEEEAKNLKRGIWIGTMQPPWEWRAHHHEDKSSGK